MKALVVLAAAVLVIGILVATTFATGDGMILSDVSGGAYMWCDDPSPEGACPSPR